VPLPLLPLLLLSKLMFSPPLQLLKLLLMILCKLLLLVQEAE
jgi:hypothetical protein